LRRGAPASAEDAPGCAAAEPAARWYEAGAVIEEQGAEQPRLRVVVNGWIGCSRSLADGRRQILHIGVPGDFCGLPSLHPQPSCCSTVALTRARVADLGPLADTLRRGDPQSRRLAAHVRDTAARDFAALTEHLVRLGRRSAVQRTAEVMLDLYRRLSRAGLAQGSTMPFPLTQEVLADYLGLSLVHTNRTLQQLRGRGLIDYRAGRLTFRDPAGMALLCGLDPQELLRLPGRSSMATGRHRTAASAAALPSFDLRKPGS